MKKLRISGLVRLAKRVRQELAEPVSPERLTRLRREVEQAVTGIERIFKEQHVRVQSLPSPSRKAFQFLQHLDWGAVAPAQPGSGSSRPPESMWFRGLPRYFDRLLDRLARAAQTPPEAAGPPNAMNRVGEGLPPAKQSRRGPDLDQAPSAGDRQSPRAQVLHGGDHHEPLDEVYETIVSDSANIEEAIRVRNIQPEQLKRQAREIRGWLAYFSQRENFDRYCAAVRRAEPVFRAACPWPAAQTVAVLVHFRPMHGMYRVRGSSDRISVHLPTPMICFDPGLLQAVARTAFKKAGDRQAVHDALVGAAYRRIDAAIELLSGVVTQTRGLHHDLAASFDRVNAEYFEGAMTRPRLVWSRTFAVRKFGHYDHARDTVMVNALLDRPTVPACAVDFLVYHELLHRHLGITWKSNRMAAHTPDFAAKERQFRQYDQAKAVLRKLASER